MDNPKTDKPVKIVRGPEFQFAQRLANNQPSTREKALKSLKKWFERISASNQYFDEDVFLRLWKGMFYYFWHCDKMLVQEDRADVISKYIHVFKSTKYSFLYIDTFFQTMCREYLGVDRYRLEKFLMLTRKMLRETFMLLKNQNWDIKYIKKFRKTLKKNVLHPTANNNQLGLKIHMSDIYMEELARAGSEEITPKLLKQFLFPYCNILAYGVDPTFALSVQKDIFLYLTNQDADTRKFHRFPILKFKANAIQKLLLKYANKPDVSRKNRQTIHQVIQDYEDFKNGITFGDKLLAEITPVERLKHTDIERAVQHLVAEEKKSSDLKWEHKKKKRKIAKRNEGIKIDE